MAKRPTECREAVEAFAPGRGNPLSVFDNVPQRAQQHLTPIVGQVESRHNRKYEPKVDSWTWLKLVSRLPSSVDDRPFWLHINGDIAGPAEEEVMKADALMRFTFSGNRSLEEISVLLARISLGVFFAISGGNKLFVDSQYKIMYETIIGAGIPFPYVSTYFVSAVEFVCGFLLIIGLLSTFCCAAFIIDMIVAITTVQLATIKAPSFIDWLDDFLYLPEVMYIIIFLWLIFSGPGRLSIDRWIAVRSGLVSADQPARAWN